MKAAFANVSEICRLKGVDNCGLALPVYPSSRFKCMVSLQPSSFCLFSLYASMMMSDVWQDICFIQ